MNGSLFVGHRLFVAYAEDSLGIVRTETKSIDSNFDFPNLDAAASSLCYLENCSSFDCLH